MEINRQALYETGLTKGEVESYLALLKIGQSSIGNIVRESQVTKSKVYDILERLIHKGLVSKSLKNNVLYYNASPPNFLLELLEKKEEKIKSDKADIKKLLPSLISLQTIPNKTEKVEVFEGFRGLKNAFQILENEFSKDEEFLVFGVDDDLSQQQLNFFVNFHKKRVESKIITKVIFTKNLKGSREHHQKISRYNQERFLNQTSAIPINIYKDIVIMPIFHKDEDEITILIRNKKLAKGFREYFYTLWKIAKP